MASNYNMLPSSSHSEFVLRLEQNVSSLFYRVKIGECFSRNGKDLSLNEPPYSCFLNIS